MEYRKLEVTRLREICRERNLPEKGTKEILVKRLRDWDLKKDIPDNQLELVGVIQGSVKVETIVGLKPKTLFIQLKATNISHYFNAGIIYPLILEESEIYVQENRKHDNFTVFPNNIILSASPVNSFKPDEALLEVIIDDMEIKEISGTSLYYCEKPIPLSRVKGIVFSSNDSRSTFISSAKTFPDFFIDEKLCFVSDRLKPVNVELGDVKIEPNLQIDKWHDTLNRYDRVLGMFSFMKNSGVIFSDREGVYEEYTQNFLSGLNILNSAISPKPTKDVPLYKYILFPGEIEVTTVQRFLFQKILKAIYENIEFDIDIAVQILKAASTSELASSEERKELNTVLVQFDKLASKQMSYKDLASDEMIRRNYPVLALLYLSKFPNRSRQHTDKQAVRNNFIEINSPLNKSVSEFLMAVLGLYYGYKTMIKEDTNLNVSDPFFLTLSERYQSIKFRLASYLERFIIESAYRFAITGSSTDDRFSYLDFERQEFRELSVPKWGIYEYNNASYSLLGMNITVYRRVNRTDRIFELLDRAYPASISGKSVLVNYLVSNFGLSKRQLIEIIKDNASRLNLDELNNLIDFDKNQKNIR
jgi:hypothetical protein